MARAVAILSYNWPSTAGWQHHLRPIDTTSEPSLGHQTTRATRLLEVVAHDKPSKAVGALMVNMLTHMVPSPSRWHRHRLPNIWTYLRPPNPIGTETQIGSNNDGPNSRVAANACVAPPIWTQPLNQHSVKKVKLTLERYTSTQRMTRIWPPTAV